MKIRQIMTCTIISLVVSALVVLTYSCFSIKPDSTAVSAKHYFGSAENGGAVMQERITASCDQKIAELEKQITQMQAQLSYRDRISVQARDGDISDAPVDESAISLEERQVREVEQKALLRAELENSMNGESLDNVWDSAMQNMLRQLLEEDLPQVTEHFSFTCKTTLCRLDMTTQSDEELENTIDLVLSESMSGNSQMLDGVTQLVDVDEKGNRTAALYFRKRSDEEVIR